MKLNTLLDRLNQAIAGLGEEAKATRKYAQRLRAAVDNEGLGSLEIKASMSKAGKDALKAAPKASVSSASAGEDKNTADSSSAK